DAFLLQPDHVFEMARQMLGDLFGRYAALRKDDVKLFTKHALGELADALLRHAPLPFRPAAASPHLPASMARSPPALKPPTRPGGRSPGFSGAPAGSAAKPAQASAACRDRLCQEARAHRGPR